MIDKDFYELIETLNAEYIALKESREYKIGNKRVKTWGYLRRFRFITLLRKLFADLYVRKYLSFPADMSAPILIHKPACGKTVVYACIAGPYDLPKEPFCPEPEVDYILYTDQPKLREDTVWQYRDIPDKVLEISDNGKVRNEYVRTHPHEFFPDYDYAIYVDGSMRIMSDVSSWTNLISPNAGIAMHRHFECECVYKEGRRNILWKCGRAEGLRAQMAHYRAEGMPKNIGRLLESTVIATDLSSPIARQIYDLWWEDFYHWGSQRDQMSIPYVLWKRGINMDVLGSLGGNVWRNPKLRHYPHEMTRYYVEKK